MELILDLCIRAHGETCEDLFRAIGDDLTDEEFTFTGPVAGGDGVALASIR